MNQHAHLPRRLPASIKVRRALPATLALLLTVALAQCGFAADEFQALVNQIPRTANAVVLLNMEKLKNSRLGVKEGWNEKVSKAFEDGLVRVPPQATRFVMASQLDFEFNEPVWEAAVMDVDDSIDLASLAKARGGTLDTIEGLPALALPNDTYLVQLGPKTLGAMAPGNRQAVVRWIRDVRKSNPSPLSPYLQKAAVYSDKAGSEIIMALDLDGVLSRDRVSKYLKAHQKQLDEWQAAEAAPATLSDVAAVFDNLQGVRVGVRIGDHPSGKLVVDLRGNATSVASFARPLLLQVLSDTGALIEDFQSWTVQAQGNEISLAGRLSTNGLRRLLSVVDSPAPESTAAERPSVSPGEQPASMATKSRDYFRAIMAMASDLRGDMKSAKNLASTSLFFDKYARRIDRMPILGVDDELVDYGAFVANTLRQASGSVRTMGIQTNVRQTQATGGGTYSSGYGYGGYRYGAMAPTAAAPRWRTSRRPAPKSAWSAPRKPQPWPPTCSRCADDSAPPRPTCGER